MKKLEKVDDIITFSYCLIYCEKYHYYPNLEYLMNCINKSHDINAINIYVFPILDHFVRLLDDINYSENKKINDDDNEYYWYIYSMKNIFNFFDKIKKSGLEIPYIPILKNISDIK